MSHFSEVKGVEVRDIAALEAAARGLGLGWKVNAKCRRAGVSERRDAVIVLQGPYDVGVTVKKGAGTLKLDADFWNGEVENELGKGLSKLKQAYAVEKLKLEAKRRGKTVRTQRLKDNSIELVIGG